MSALSRLKEVNVDRFSVWFEDLAVKLFFIVLIGLGALIFTKTAISLIFLFI